MANTNDNNGASLGKYGAAYLDTTDLFVPPTGMVITAIQFLAQNTLTRLTAIDTTAGARRFFNTTNAAHSAAESLEGSNGQQLDNTCVFPAGTTIYGRWSTVQLQTADSDGGVIIYLAPIGS